MLHCSAADALDTLLRYRRIELTPNSHIAFAKENELNDNDIERGNIFKYCSSKKTGDPQSVKMINTSDVIKIIKEHESNIDREKLTEVSRNAVRRIEEEIKNLSGGRREFK